MPRAGASGPARLGAVLLGAVLVLSGCVFGVTSDSHVVTDNRAVLTGTLWSTQADHTEYWFEYGSTAGYESETAPVGIDLVTGSTPVSMIVDGLNAASSYHYRLCNDVPGSTSGVPFCGADRTVVTGSGRVSVQGTGTNHVPFSPFTAYLTQSINAAADPGGVGYVDGTANDDVVFRPNGSPGVEYPGTGTGTVSCLRVEGNVAVAGFTATYISTFGGTTVEASRLFVVEDNGPTGDRYALSSWTPADGCPAPSSDLIPPGTPDTADFTVHAG